MVCNEAAEGFLVMTIIAKHTAREYYQAELANGTDRLFERRSPNCPWCGSADIHTRLSSRDILQGKPGIFTLDRCGDCGHIFQNPRLSSTGLDFYYRDYYDGLGAKSAERLLRNMEKLYARRARMLRRHATTAPRSWLDVGTGYGHFCRTAKAIFPDTRFDGLDFGDGVLQGKERGWIDTAYHGSFPELAISLAGRYDVVSMHHYLEHTLDPHAELRAAAEVVAPGGYVLIEVPDPDSTPARLFGKYWSQWAQPQHLHMFPLTNLARALGAVGLSVVAVDRRRSDLGHDFLLATFILLKALGPDPRRVWARRPVTSIDYIRWITARALVPPAIVVGIALDMVLRPAIPHRSNAYRILATRPARSDIARAERATGTKAP